MPKQNNKYISIKKLLKINDMRDFQIAILKFTIIIFLIVLAIFILR